MVTEQANSDSDANPNFSPRILGIALVVIGMIVAGGWLANRFNAVDLARDLSNWNDKLNLIAESRNAEVENWVSENFKELRTLADNPSLQLYMTELQMMPQTDSGASPADSSQKAYLRNLLLFTAQRSGYGMAGNPASAIPANVQAPIKGGLAIVDINGAIVVSTVMPQTTKDIILDHVKESKPAQEALIDIRKDKDGVPYIGFILPIFSIQGDRNAASQLGRVVGIKTLDGNFSGLLKHPGLTEKTLEAILVRSDDDNLSYLSPLLDGTEPLGKTLPANGKLAEATLVKSPGSFSSELKDYHGNDVLATSRSVSGTPWTLIVKVNRQEALADSIQRRSSMAALFFLLIAVIVLIVISIWWRTHSKQARLLSGHFRRLADKAVAQERLLRLVADHQPEPIYIVDGDMTIRFVNKQAGSEAHMALDSIPGRSLWDVRGAGMAIRVAEECKAALAGGTTISDIRRVKQNGQKEKVIRSVYVPLAHIPVVTLPDPTPGVLVVEQDISEVMHEREQRLKTQRQLIEMLVTLVDKRDPFAANHSKMVSQIAFEVAKEMELDSVTMETTSKAGSLMNVGKITVPTELLTKATALTGDEKRTIHDSMGAAAELLNNISFDGPVVETLRQWQEKWDGSGPLQLKGEAILISARIIAVANAFVGMISPRSWRNAMSIENATKMLLEQADTDFDRKVVIATVHFVENQHGREWIKSVFESGKKPI